MSLTTPRRSLRIPHVHVHTPKTSERKKGLDFSKDSMQKHRLPVVESESDGEGCDLGIISALDTSSSDEAIENQMIEAKYERITRSHTRRFLRQTGDIKEFIKSPYTLNNFQSGVGSTPKWPSTPHTPQHQHHSPMTPSSSSSHNSISSRTRARKSLASLIADTESCSSSLKDLNFDTDSGNDSKENTPSKKASKARKTTPSNFLTFKGVLKSCENSENSPSTTIVNTDLISPTHMLKTPQSQEVSMSPPKIGHGRKYNVTLTESPEVGSSHKRNRSDSSGEGCPISKHPRLDTSVRFPKAKASLFNCKKLKQILSAKSFYAKNADLTTRTTESNDTSTKIMAANLSQPKRSFSQSYKRRRNSKKAGLINVGVKHKIRKPKFRENKLKLNASKVLMGISEEHKQSNKQSSTQNNLSPTMLTDKFDPFAKEKQTIENLLSQWEDDAPLETNTTRNISDHIKEAEDLICFNKSTLDETVLLNPNMAIPVQQGLNTHVSEQTILDMDEPSQCNENTLPLLPISSIKCNAVLVQDDDDMMSLDEVCVSARASLLPVDGGFMIVNENSEDIPDLDAIENEIKMLDDQIKEMAEKNNIDATVLLTNESASSGKVFPIFVNPDPGIKAPVKTSPVKINKKKIISKSGHDQYIIDAGQKKIGATQCNECGVIYQLGDAQDENDHSTYHNATDVLRYNGYKDEEVVGVYGSARCIKVQGTNEQRWKKVNSLLERVVHPQLGYAAPIHNSHGYTAYLYVDKKRVIGCLIAEPRSLSNKFIPGDVECCSVEQFRVKCGISRIWTHKSHRNKGVATRLVDCMRRSLLHGDVLSLKDISFSSPTPAGRDFAVRYTGTKSFYVYME